MRRSDPCKRHFVACGSHLDCSSADYHPRMGGTCAVVTPAANSQSAFGATLRVLAPRTRTASQALAGVSLLALSAISGIGCLLGAALLLWGWASLLTAAALLATATAVAAFAGTAALFLSAVLACMGTAVLSAAAGAYVAGVLLARLRSAGRAYLLL